MDLRRRYGKGLQLHPDGFKDTLTAEIKEGLALSGSDIARAEIAHTDMWRRFQTFLSNYDYFILPTTQLPPSMSTCPGPPRSMAFTSPTTSTG